MGQLLLELRELRRKYQSFTAQAVQSGSNLAFSALAWKEFESDLKRMLQILGSSILWSFCR